MTVFFSTGLDDYTGANKVTGNYLLGLASKGVPVVLLYPQASFTTDDGDNGQPRLSEKMSAAGIETVAVSVGLSAAGVRSVGGVLARLSLAKTPVVVGTFQADTKILAPLCALLGVPFVYFGHNIGRFSGPAWARSLKHLLWRMVLKSGVGAVIAVSDEVRGYLHHACGYPLKDIRVITNAVGFEIDGGERPAAGGSDLRRELGVGESTFVIVNVGRLDEQKDQLALIEAAAVMAREGVDFYVVLVGGISPTAMAESMAYRDQLVSRVEKLGLSGRVCFLGWRNDVGALLRQADVYAHSARWEGFPLAVLEAWAVGRPVVTTDCFQLPVDVGLGACEWGARVAVGEVSGLAAQLARIARVDAGERQRMGEASRVFSRRHFDLKQRVEELRHCLAGILAARGVHHVV
jgi:glycosyltransferase involved in cell wall biosynthesis